MREKAKQLVTLLKDEERLRVERIHALKTKEKMAQTSSGETRPRMFFSHDQAALHIGSVASFPSLLSSFSAQHRGQPVRRLPFRRCRPGSGLATELWRGRSAAPAGFGDE